MTHLADGMWKASVLDYSKMMRAFINFGTFEGTQLLNATTVTKMR